MWVFDTIGVYAFNAASYAACAAANACARIAAARPVEPEDIHKRLRCTLHIRVTVQRRRPRGRAPIRVVLQPHPRRRVIGAGRELGQTIRLRPDP